MKENFPQPASNVEEPERQETPQFVKQFSRENSQEERDSIAAAIRERRRERDAWGTEQNSRMEGKENIGAELEALRGQVETYGDEGFLGKIKDYFAYRNAKAQIEDKLGALTIVQGKVDEGESGKPEFREVKTLLKNFYEGEKDKWANAGYAPEDLEQQLTEEHLAKLSVDDYATLMRRFPGEMLTHVTRQGIRDHASSIWHTAGTGSYANGFKDMLKEKHLRSSIGIALQEHNKETAVAKFLRLDTCRSREDALSMSKSKLEWNLASNNAFADVSAVHVASEHVMDAMYGSERGNEIFIAFPSVYVASQLRYGGKGTLADTGRSEHNDKWIYTKDHEGMPIDAGLVFIPGDAQVDPRTGSRYELDQNQHPIENQNLIDSIEGITASPEFPEFAERAEKILGALTGHWSEKNVLLSQTQMEQVGALCEELKQRGIEDKRAQQAILDYDFLRGLKYDRDEGVVNLIKKSLTKRGALYSEAINAVSSKEYWEAYFVEHPDDQPSKIVYYSGGDPSLALNEWREKNGIVKRTKDSTYGFAEHNIADSSAEANVGKNRFASLAQKVIDDQFPDVPKVKRGLSSREAVSV